MSANPQAGRFDRVLNIVVAVVMSIGAALCWFWLSAGIYDFVRGIFAGRPFEWNAVFALIIVGWLTMVTTYIVWWCVRSPRIPLSPKDHAPANRWLICSSVLVILAGIGLDLFAAPGKSTLLSGHNWVWLGLGLFYMAIAFRRKSK